MAPQPFGKTLKDNFLCNPSHGFISKMLMKLSLHLFIYTHTHTHTHTHIYIYIYIYTFTPCKAE